MMTSTTDSEEITVHIDELAFGGHGVGRLDSGKVVLVRGAAPSERLTARVVEDKRSHVMAVVDQVLDPSPERRSPECPVAGLCGGCSWMHLGIETQRAWKQRLLIRELLRAGVVDHPEVVADMAGGAALGYRIRSRLHVRGGRFGTLGARSHEVVPFDRCPVMAHGLERFALELAERIASARAVDADLELFVDTRDRRGLFIAPMKTSGEASWSKIASPLGVDALRFARSKKRPRRARGARAVLEERSGSLALAFEPGLFVQSNREMNARLVADVLSAAQPGGDTFAEVYAGVGNFTVHLAAIFDRGVAFERERRAVSLLRQNLGEAASRVRARALRDIEATRELATMTSVDLLVVDPPRAGMKPLLSLFSTTSFCPQRIVMVSCHPMTAVRDLTALVRQASYHVVKVMPVDLFPQTHHLELVAVLERR